jgi:hypothetical protein
VPDRRTGLGRGEHSGPVGGLSGIAGILANAGITLDESLDMASVPAEIRRRLNDDIAALRAMPTPPFRPPADLAEQIAA